MTEYDFSSLAALRRSLGEPRPRNLVEMVELALAAADRDQETLLRMAEKDGWNEPLTARRAADRVIGFDLNNRIREVLQIIKVVQITPREENPDA